MPKTSKLTIEYINLGNLNAHPALNGYHIKEAEFPHCPVAIVPEPLGGMKVKGRSPKQEDYARLLGNAPETLEALKALRDWVGDLPAETFLSLPDALFDKVNLAIAKAEGR